MIEQADVAIIGGGIIGTAAAFYLARDTKLSVALFERKSIGSGSTGMSAGVVRHYYSTDLLVKSAIQSRKIFESFKDSVGEPLEYVKNGYIAVDPPELAKTAPDRVEDMRKNGLDAEVLSPDVLRRDFPYLHVSEGEVASFDREAGYVPNPGDAARIYARQAQRHGAKVYEMTPVTGIRVDGRAVAAVRTSFGDVAAGRILNAAGPWAREVGRMVGLDIPVESERQQLLDLKPAEPWPVHRPTISDRKYYTYLLPGSSGTAHIGGHYFALKCDPSDFKSGADQDFIDDIVPKVVERCPGLARATVAAGYSGLYETTADRYPLVGESEEVSGFITAAGFSGHGFKHGPMFGILLKELIERGSTSLAISMLRPERFQKGHPVDTPYARIRAPYG